MIFPAETAGAGARLRLRYDRDGRLVLSQRSHSMTSCPNSLISPQSIHFLSQILCGEVREDQEVAAQGEKYQHFAGQVVDLLPVFSQPPHSKLYWATDNWQDGEDPVAVEGGAELEVPTHLEVVQDRADTWCIGNGSSATQIRDSFQTRKGLLSYISTFL